MPACQRPEWHRLTVVDTTSWRDGFARRQTLVCTLCDYHQRGPLTWQAIRVAACGWLIALIMTTVVAVAVVAVVTAKPG